MRGCAIKTKYAGSSTYNYKHLEYTMHYNFHMYIIVDNTFIMASSYIHTYIYDDYAHEKCLKKRFQTLLEATHQ